MSAIQNVPQTAHPGQSHTGSQAVPIESPLDEIHFLQYPRGTPSTLIPHLEHVLATAHRRFAALSLIEDSRDNARAMGAK